MDLSLVNTDWKTAFKYNFPLKRDLFSDLVDSIYSKFIITIIDLRRTGKTTLMKQLMKQFNLSKGIVITKNLEKSEGEVHFIPAWKFILENT